MKKALHTLFWIVFIAVSIYSIDQLFDIERARGNEYYYYKCDKCNGIFKTTHYFKYEN